MHPSGAAELAAPAGLLLGLGLCVLVDLQGPDDQAANHRVRQPTEERSWPPDPASDALEKSGALWPSPPSQLWQTYQSAGQDYWPPHDHYDRFIFAARINDVFAPTRCPDVGAGARAGRARALSPEASGCSADGFIGAAPSPSGVAGLPVNVPPCSPTLRRTGWFAKQSAQGDSSPDDRTLASSLGLSSGKDSEACSDEDEQAAETMTHASQVRVRCSHAPRHEISCFQLRPCIISTHSSTRSRVLSQRRSEPT